MKRLLFLTFLLFVNVGTIQAQKQKISIAEPHWYIGADAGVSFGNSTFKSFGMDKTRIGFGIGLLGGYHINQYISAEAELSYRYMGLGAYDCCQHLFLGADGNRYFAPVAGVNSWQYNDLHSSVNLYGLGARLNVDFVKMFKPTSRWSFLISPAIYSVLSSANIITISTDKEVKNGTSFHFGAGGDLGVGYQISPKINIRLYSGITLLTGKGIDALPQVEHKSNYTWNSGVKVTFAISKRKTKQTVSQPTYSANIQTIETVKDETKNEVKKEVVEPTNTSQAKQEELKVVEKAPVCNEVYKATVYYAFNDPFVREDSSETIQKLLNAIKKHSQADIAIEAWSDQRGTTEANNNTSTQRAKLLKDYLIRQKVAESRITIKGNGVDTMAESDTKARRAEIKLYVVEK